MAGWVRFFRQWQKDLKLWLFFMSFFLVFRIIFIVVFRDQIHVQSTYTTIMAALLNGLRYDSVICTLFVIIPFCFSVASGLKKLDSLADTIRLITGVVFLVLSSFICIVTMEYFKEFGDQFNHFLFGLIYDDLRATLWTIIKAYHVGRNAVIIILILILGTSLMKMWIRHPVFSPAMNARLSSSLPSRIGLTVLMLCLMVFGIRGSMSTVPVRERHAAITTDSFLNKTIINPYMALRYAVKQQVRLTGTEGFREYVPDNNLAGSCQYAFATDDKGTDLDRYMLRFAQGPKGIVPRHIFFILAESYSAWPMWDKYARLQIAEGVKGLARDGISIVPFIAGHQGSMTSLSTIITGLLDGDIKANYRPRSQNPYPTSIAGIFKRMGYRVRFFYGGYLSWQRVGDFCMDQGFDEVYGGGHMGRWASSNEWGVDDEHLFSFVIDKVKDDIPSFNLIFTTSNHSPYTVDIRSKGFSMERISEVLHDMRSDRAGEDELILFLGHFWYADKQTERFIRTITTNLSRSLVVLTADHPGRVWIKKNPGPLERFLVPCVFYGPEVLRGIEPRHEMAGSHLDISQTLIELSAPRGFPYHSMGKDLLGNGVMSVAVGRNLVTTPYCLLDINQDERIVPLSGAVQPVQAETIIDLKRYHDILHGIAWWRIMKGPNIPDMMPDGVPATFIRGSWSKE